MYVSILPRLEQSVIRFGWRGAIRRWLLRVLYFTLGIKIWVCFQLEKVNPQLAQLPPNFSAGLIDPLLLDPYIGDGFGFDRELLESAGSRNLDAYAIIDKEKGLACVDWIARLPGNFGDHTASFPRDSVYGQRIETHPHFRGHGLFAAAVHGALAEYQKRGYRAMVAHVEAHNLSSLRGVYRGEHKRIGFVVMGNWFGKPFALHSPGCRRARLHFNRTPMPKHARTGPSKVPVG